MARTARARRRTMKKGTTTKKRPERVLTLKVGGQIRPGRIAIPDLLLICQHVQSAMNRQAEAHEGGAKTNTLRPGPATGKARIECTLELAGIRHGSPTTALGFELAKPQQPLPGVMRAFGEDVIDEVLEALESVSEGRTESVDPGVLDSLNNLGEVFDRSHRVRSIQWIRPQGRGRKRREVVFNQQVRQRVAQRLALPTHAAREIEGVVAMADFNPIDRRCRVDPVFGPSIMCEFRDDQADQIQRVIRQPAKLTGEATVSPTGSIEILRIATVTPLEPLTLGANNFFAAHSFEQLAKMQAVEPLDDITSLAGGWPENEDIDQAMAEIYARRE